MAYVLNELCAATNSKPQPIAAEIPQPRTESQFPRASFFETFLCNS
jgi:hypothetical protein